METSDTSRFQDAGQTIYDFGAEFLVRCPRCGQRAKVAPMAATAESDAAPDRFAELFAKRARCVCSSCGAIQEWRGKSLGIGGPMDWYFGLPVWLQTPCCGHVLWAYNTEHLAFLEAYIQATLREQRSIPNRNRALTSRLPLWMKRRQNRAGVFKGIARLKRLLD